MDRGPFSDLNFGEVPLHQNSRLPRNNKGIGWETGIILSNFVERYRPKQVVELGTFQGYSTSWLIMGTLLAGTGRVDAFEVFPEGSYGPMWYDEYDLPKSAFRYHEIPGGIWKFPEEIPETIDLLYHDTEHLPAPTEKEMDLLLPRVPVGGIVLVDDMLVPNYGPMQALFHNLFYTGYWAWSVFPLGNGLGVARRIK